MSPRSVLFLLLVLVFSTCFGEKKKKGNTAAAEAYGNKRRNAFGKGYENTTFKWVETDPDKKEFGFLSFSFFLIPFSFLTRSTLSLWEAALIHIFFLEHALQCLSYLKTFKQACLAVET